MKNKLFAEFTKGIIKENPTFSIILGMCPTLAITTNLINGIGMGVATTFVLIGSNILVASLKDFIPDKIRLPAYIVIIATFVTVVELLMKAFTPALSAALGIFVPLIVVNCIILGRAEAFANRNSVLASIFDALGMGLGFTGAVCIICLIRELLGAGTIMGYRVSMHAQPALLFSLAPGALLVLGLLIGLYAFVFKRESV